MQRNNVSIREGLPEGIHVSATEKERARTRALVQQLVPTALGQPGMLVGSLDLSKPTAD